MLLIPTIKPDIHVFGFQELDLSPDVLMFEKQSTREGEWCDALQEFLTEDYIRVESKILVGMLIVVYIRNELKERVKNVLSASVGTGPMGFGNKGGVSIRFDLDNTSFCFVNAHLAAHQNEVEKRNEDFKEIIAKTVFWKTNNEPNTQGKPSASPFVANSTEEVPQIYQHDRTFWAGDLNYRLNAPIDEVKNYIFQSRFEDLVKIDQLKEQQCLKKSFERFIEGPISFAPTYKFAVGTNQYSGGAKVRSPAYCDRILYCQPSDKSGIRLVPGSYRSHPSITLSDHKPVSAVFEVTETGPKSSRAPLEQADSKGTLHTMLAYKVSNAVAQMGRLFSSGSISKPNNDASQR